MIKAVLFDMDGVLVDTEWFYNRRRVAFMEEKGFHFDEIPDLSGSNEPAIWEALVPDDVEPAECLVIEDSPLGIEAGKRSGARVLALRPHEGVNLDQSRADAVIDNLTDILAAL